jgi:hypothetical protein
MGRLRWFVVGAVVATAVSAAAQTALQDVPASHWAGSAIRKSVAMGLMAAPGGKFQPDRPVTRAELAVVLVRMIDAVEKAGPKPFHNSPAKREVPPAQHAALDKLPASDPGTPAMRRLVDGGYLSPMAHRGQVKAGWMPTAANFNKPVTAREVSDAVRCVVLRIEEKKVAVQHPEALQEGDRPETR